MNKEFILYEEALAMKELGFDEECAYHYKKSSTDDSHSNNTTIEMKRPFGYNHNVLPTRVSAPLYQQAFRWFSDTYKLSFHVDLKSIDHTGKNYYYKIVNFADFTVIIDGFPDYESAQLACLKQLIKYTS